MQRTEPVGSSFWAAAIESTILINIAVYPMWHGGVVIHCGFKCCNPEVGDIVKQILPHILYRLQPFFATFSDFWREQRSRRVLGKQVLKGVLCDGSRN
jgi:hypothetical protein